MADTNKTGPPPAYPANAGGPSGGQAPPYSGGQPPQQQQQQPMYGAQQPAQGAPQPGYAGQQPAYGAQQPAYGAQQPAYGAQQPAYGAPQQAYGGQQTTVVFSQPGFVQGASYGPSPTSLTCPHCSANVTTTTSKECGGMVWMVAGIICLIGLFFPLVWLGCCLIPFCIPSLYNTRHSCPNCQRQLGTYQQGGM